ncbi:uncharacterized protein N7482_002025 [Penicillium canariense]|uniref:Uncharacterized protein n=1 Tax=Penicillium canariense TaxID=189055 RepID=A0A9W9LTI4_9EURO|nr:uncharacterized protein N7482_002025 [Penicillium canariense]KAJ5176148.1 hypothetical protein N7482_002025 [Penicillium canariense]
MRGRVPPPTSQDDRVFDGFDPRQELRDEFVASHNTASQEGRLASYQGVSHSNLARTGLIGGPTGQCDGKRTEPRVADKPRIRKRQAIGSRTLSPPYRECSQGSPFASFWNFSWAPRDMGPPKLSFAVSPRHYVAGWGDTRTTHKFWRRPPS